MRKSPEDRSSDDPGSRESADQEDLLAYKRLLIENILSAAFIDDKKEDFDWNTGTYDELRETDPEIFSHPPNMPEDPFDGEH